MLGLIGALLLGPRTWPWRVLAGSEDPEDTRPATADRVGTARDGKAPRDEGKTKIHWKIASTAVISGGVAGTRIGGCATRNRAQWAEFYGDFAVAAAKFGAKPGKIKRNFAVRRRRPTMRENNSVLRSTRLTNRKSEHKNNRHFFNFFPNSPLPVTPNHIMHTPTRE